LRTFIAIELDEALKRSLVRVLDSLPRSRDVRWVRETQLHITLRFLGAIEGSRVQDVVAIMTEASAAIAPFPVRLAGLGCFPSPRRPRVLWAGIEDPGDRAASWVALVEPRLRAAGFEGENRPFSPHVTLGRSQSPAGSDRLRRALDQTPKPQTAEMLVREVVLFESRLLPGGAQYTPLARTRLTGSPNAGTP
jgi:2'-5' RNA ligase